MTKTWQTYEEVAQYLLDKFSEKLGLACVEPKQTVSGQISGTKWEIDAKGVESDDESFIIVECRRYTTSRLSQEDMAAIAFRIFDTGANGAIVVSPLDLQSGAKKVAKYADILHVKLTPESTTKEYVIEILNNVFMGLHEEVSPKITDSFTITVRDESDNIVDERHG